MNWKIEDLNPKKSVTTLNRSRLAFQLLCQQGPSSQGSGFSSSHVWMWELDCEESWAPRNWYFWIVVLEKTRESPLDFKESQTVHPKWNESWICIGRTDVEAKTSILGNLIWRADSFEKTLMLERLRQEEKGMTEDEMAGWHHQLDGHEFE